MKAVLNPYNHVQHRLFLCLIFSILGILLSQVAHSSEPNSDDWHYTLRPGDTLQSISKKLLGRQHTWNELVHHNHIDQISAISPGSIISIPMRWLKHQPQPARIIAITGSAQIKRSGKTQFNVLKQNMKIRVGDEVATRKGNVLIEFADKSTVRLEEQSTLIFNRLTHFGKTGMVDTRLRLKQGSLSTDVTPLVKGSRYEISTPSAVAAVRGTKFRLITDDKETQLEVIRGSVNFSGSHGEVMVAAGQGAIIKQGSAIIERSTLPIAPKPDFENEAITELPTKLTWKPQKDSGQYRFELTDDKKNNKLIKLSHSNKPELTLDHVQNGNYSLAMRAVNPKGFGGVDNVSNLKIAITTEVPELVAPLDTSIIETPQLMFSWQLKNATILSQLMIARDSDFKTIITEKDFSADKTITINSELRPGTYYWRINALAENGVQSVSHVRSFSIKGVLAPVKILSVNYVENQVGLFWSKVDNAQQYLLQISDSKSFRNILKEQILIKSKAHLKLNSGKYYYARVKAIGSDLYTAKFGPIKDLYITP